MLAKLAAERGKPRGFTVLGQEAAALLAQESVGVLPGIGPAQARRLASLGLEFIGQLAITPLPTLQRVLGAGAGRRVHQRARGEDPTRVTTTSVLRALTSTRELGRDELDPTRHRRAHLGLAADLGLQLRTQEQTAASLALTVRYADRTTTLRSRALPEATAHTPDLAAAAYRLYDALALQRARVRALTLKADGIRPAEQAAHQLTFDPVDDRRRRLEAVADRARHRFGADALAPASLYGAA
jgi:nucleotidyltransferase/DNA polymerase involved in DNA repair